LSSRIVRADATFLNFYVSHNGATRFYRNGEKYYALASYATGWTWNEAENGRE